MRRIVAVLEASLKTVRGATLDTRVERARKSKSVDVYLSEVHPGVRRYQFSVLSKEQVEGRGAHKGYIKMLPNGECEVSCTCKDHQFRWERALKDVDSARIIFSNGEKALRTNPANIHGLCKHVYTASIRIPELESRKEQ